jgi:hypothetical protein
MREARVAAGMRKAKQVGSFLPLCSEGRARGREVRRVSHAKTPPLESKSSDMQRLL